MRAHNLVESFMFWLAVAALVLLAFTLVKLRGENLAHLDDPLPPAPDTGRYSRGRERIAKIRDFMDHFSDGRQLDSEIRSVSEGALRGEWVLAPGYDPGRRLLYIHGGAWIAGSPRSHRSVTNKLALTTGCAVFAVDYRLMPEHSRKSGIDDTRAAYRWILDNGPDGREALDFLVVAGDSAGGNLTLSLIAWIRDEGLRRPDAAIAFSPATDGTLTAPSLRGNLATDPMLGPTFGHLTRIPTPLLWWSTWLTTRYMPSDPVISPLRGDLGGLPPLLIQVSESEMLLDDARRYVSKAQAAGSPVELQTWPHVVHVWQVFTPELPEAEEAYERVADFLQGVEAKAA
jgi:monoterpene epsilon-lactone hydrolase